MANAKLKCRGCKERFPRDEMKDINGGNFHSMDCAIQYGMANKDKARKKAIEKQRKEFNRETKRRKKAIKRRSEWYEDLQTEVNKFVLLRDYGKPCCTCGKTDPGVKYDAGHMLSRGANPDMRFELTNIHKQCSVNCNQWGSGMRKEYEQFIVREYGQEHLDWMLGPHTPLKELFPTHEDIEKEIKKYRAMCKEQKKLNES